MFPQRGTSVEGFVTDVTAERLLSRVGPYMFSHVSFQFETLPTKVAAVRSLSCVHPHVVLQIALTGYVFATYVTVKVSFALLGLAFMCLEVPREHSFFCEYEVAYVASV